MRRVGRAPARSFRNRDCRRTSSARSQGGLHRRDRGCRDARDQRHDPRRLLPPHDTALQQSGEGGLLERQGRRPRRQTRPHLRGLGRHRCPEEGRREGRSVGRRQLGGELHPRGEVNTPKVAGRAGTSKVPPPRHSAFLVEVFSFYIKAESNKLVWSKS